MYLTAGKYISAYSHDSADRKSEFDNVLKALKLNRAELQDHTPSLTVRVTVAYWRKANAIHKWFVDNCQDGVDECQEASVSREQLEQLLTLCKRALDNKEEAPSALPPQSGFFFGSTEIDESYFADIEETVSQLEAILSCDGLNDYSFAYQSSW